MKSWQFGASALALGALLSLSGCGGSTTTPAGSSKDEGTKETPGTMGKKTALKSGKAMIKGTVTFEGPMPDIAALNKKLHEEMKTKVPDDAAHCMSDKAGADKEEQEWKINPENKGLKGVVVFLIPEQGTFFACSADDEGVKKVKDKALDIKQPYCAFEPHVAVLFPSYKDEKNKTQKTGEKVVVFNNTDTAPDGKKGGISHNTKWGGTGQVPGNVTIPQGTTKDITDLVPNLKSPVSFQCSIHTWMNAAVWVLDNPYYAITDADGKYEIKNAPAAGVKIVAWHNGTFLNSGESKGESMKLKDGDNTKDFTAKK